MQMSEEQSFPCDELGCDRSFKNRTALLKHKRDTHIAQTRKSTRVREGGRVYNPSATSPSKFTVAQASRNSANRRKRPNTEETDTKKAKKSHTCTNSKRTPDPASAAARSANLLHDIAGSVSKPPGLFHGIDLNTPGDDKCQGSDGWWRRCKRFNNTKGKLCKQWFFWHETMKNKTTIRSLDEARVHGKLIKRHFIGLNNSDKPYSIVDCFARQDTRTAATKSHCDNVRGYGTARASSSAANVATQTDLRTSGVPKSPLRKKLHGISQMRHSKHGKKCEQVKEIWLLAVCKLSNISLHYQVYVRLDKHYL